MEIKNKMEEVLSINSENYDYEMLDDIYKKLSSRITDLKINSEKGEIADKSSLFEGEFIINFNNDPISIKIIYFLHLLIIGYIIEFEATDNEEIYRSILSNYIQESIKNYKDEKEKKDSLHFENDKKIYDALIEILKMSENIFISLIDNIKKKLLKEMLEGAISKFNLLNKELNNILREKNKIDVKLRKIYEKIENIFENEIFPIFGEYYLDEINNKFYLLIILKDSIKAIYTCLILEREKNRNELKFFFDNNTWFIYLCSILFSNYNKNKINLLKLNQNIDFLKFGADIRTVTKITKDFITRNNLKNMKKEFEAEIFYILLSTGYYDKTLYTSEILDKSYKFELYLVDKEENKVFKEGLEVYRLNTGLMLLDFVNMILTKENNNLKKNIEVFYDKFNDIKFQNDDEIEEINDIELIISNIFKSLEEDMFFKYEEIKKIYYSGTKAQKIHMIKEFIGILINRINIKINSKKNIEKNYEIALENLKYKINYEIQIVQDKNLSDKIMITHNLLEFFNLKKNTGKNLDRKSMQKNKKIIKISVNSDIIEQDGDIKVIINMKIFFLLMVYLKVRDDRYFSTLSEELKGLYFNILVDITCLLNLKENLLLQKQSFIEENDYFDYLSEKIESYFLSLYLNKREDIKKINLEVVKEAQEYLNVFKNALINSYFYYKNNNEDFILEKDFDNNVEEVQNIFIDEVNRDMHNIIDRLVENLSLDKIFI